ncbi:MAG: LacI family DNA-binding transcriptional regulator, partial [Planctomycetes bacterium]|nr:LacI family DNA-binding transcriptional regulator [Planctomycetota bacterium]
KGGMTVYQCEFSEDVNVICRHVEDMLSRNVDALVLRCPPYQLRDKKLTSLLASVPAVVAISREDIPEFKGDLVVHDRDRAICEIVEYLAKTGRRKPAMCLSVDHEANAPKFNLFKKECRRHGIKKHSNILINLDYPDSIEDNGPRHVRGFKRAFPKTVDIDAIFCFNDTGAMYIMRELQERGISVPDDVAVIGFNGFKIGEIWSPPLATGDRKHAGVTQALIGMLDKRIAGCEDGPMRETINMEFVWRESAGPKPE